MAPASNSSDAAPVAPHVLVVDDSRTMRGSVVMTLELAGYRVTSASDGREALDHLQRGLRPDLLLTDIVMPGMGGIELIREARKRLPSTPIVTLTTQGQRYLRDEGKTAGATAWLTKPTGGRELLDMVRQFIAARQSAQQPIG
ncbi:MAG: response regulator [Rubrivivax sp.]|jgi:two-component system chemotaxis response regulator CheY